MPSLPRTVTDRQTLTLNSKQGRMGSTPPDEDEFCVAFLEADPRNPLTFSPFKKWSVVSAPIVLSVLASSTASAYTLGIPSMMRDTHCTNFQATLGLSVYALGYGVVPLFTSAFSESCGRQPLYLISLTGCILSHLMAALSRNGPMVIVARALQGSFGGVVTIVGGTIADLWLPHERGLPMSIFTAAVFAGNALGPVVSGWVEENPHLGWRWIQYIHMICFGACMILLLTVTQETRSSILLTRLAKSVRTRTGDVRFHVKGGDDQNLRDLIITSCTRPFYLLIKEPVVTSFSVWISFVWGVYYCMLGSIPGILRNTHNFTSGEVGTAYVSILLGSLVGFITSIYQERIYRKKLSEKGPEARLYLACCSAVIFPMGMFLYAWSASPSVPWIVLELGIIVCVWGIFGVYVSVFSYLTDCYGPYASSALAAQSFLRNLTATGFPLFIEQMFRAWSYTWGNTLFACVGVALIPIPYVLFFYGPRIRQRSRFSAAVMIMQ
ncbi:MFS polyamine transporter [Mycena crocata]|nr:MFS polyamine transporter [Mycena crocata]